MSTDGQASADRLSRALDMLLKYLLAEEDRESETTAQMRLYSSEVAVLEGGSSSASKSARRTRRPPPDLSSK